MIQIWFLNWHYKKWLKDKKKKNCMNFQTIFKESSILKICADVNRYLRWYQLIPTFYSLILISFITTSRWFQDHSKDSNKSFFEVKFYLNVEVIISIRLIWFQCLQFKFQKKENKDEQFPIMNQKDLKFPVVLTITHTNNFSVLSFEIRWRNSLHRW